MGMAADILDFSLARSVCVNLQQLEALPRLIKFFLHSRARPDPLVLPGRNARHAALSSLDLTAAVPLLCVPHFPIFSLACRHPLFLSSPPDRDLTHARGFEARLACIFLESTRV